MNLGEFRKLTAELPDDTMIVYHAYYKGCCHSAYSADMICVSKEHGSVVINPGKDYDNRASVNNKSKGVMISNCCGVQATGEMIDIGICPECKEHCEFEEEVESYGN